MFRIGFDPIMEVEQQHRELMKQSELYRLASESKVGNPSNTRNATKVLAFLGKQMVSFGASLEARYGVADNQAALTSQTNSDGCVS